MSVPLGAAWPLNPAQDVTLSVGQDIMIPASYNLRIECPILRANPSPSISWFHGNATIPGRHTQYTVETDGTLVIKNVTKDRDDGTYTCVADTENVGQDEITTTVIVTGKRLIP